MRVFLVLLFSVVVQAAPFATPLGVVTSEKDWLNTSRALTQRDLKGRVVLLDFWTYCCINCMHVIAELHELEKEFGPDLTVIGVHSAKYTNEKDRENIRQAILRYDIGHPVVNDAAFKIWNEFGVGGWPTLVLLGRDGQIAKSFSGEGNQAAVREAVRGLLPKKRPKLKALPLSPERDRAPRSILSFPGKVISVPDYDGQPLLFIADSGNDRVLGVRTSGKIEMKLGELAGLKHPQGLLYRDKMLWVADTGNHLLRRFDLATGKVESVADKLRSPWDLAFYPSDKEIAIAMAGTHQLWSYHLEKKVLSPLAGSGAEGIQDGPARAAKLAQPSGLSVAKDKLYFVDSETSSLRYLEGDKVTTLVGTGLFDFGFKDGKPGEALMQHPLGVLADGDTIYVADSYNHAIRKWADGKLTTFAKGLNEPNAIAKGKDVFYVADTNNHVIREVKADGTAEPLVIYEEKPRAPEARLPNMKQDAEAAVAPGAALVVALPKDWKINDKAPSWLAVFEGEKPLREYAREEIAKKKLELPKLPPGKYRLQGTFYFCREGANALCLIQSRDRTLVVKANAAASLDIPLQP